MSRTNLLNHTRKVLRHLAFGVSIVFLLASHPILADEEKISELLLEAQTALENNQYQRRLQLRVRRGRTQVGKTLAGA